MVEDEVRAAAFVRNVMVGRQGLSRQVLLEIFERAGARNPRSYLATGNVTFSSPRSEHPQLIDRLERGIAEVLERREPVFVRTVDHLAGLVRANPFRTAPDPQPHERCVSFLLDPPKRGQLELPLRPRRDDVTVFAWKGAEVFSVTRLVAGRPGTAGPLLEAALAQRVTTRNWRTIVRIVDDPESAGSGGR